jgi:regulator of protease activity HflC (stomatin/prohibitin superfamily)
MIETLLMTSGPSVFFGVLVGAILWFIARCLISGLYTVDQNQRAVKTVFGRAQRRGSLTTLQDPVSNTLNSEEKERYAWPQVQMIPAGGPYFKFPWEEIHKVSVAIETASIGYDPEVPSANRQGTILEAVTKDQLNTGLRGQIRYSISERNLYAYLFGIKNPVAHIMGYFISILRERISNFEAPPKPLIENAPPSLVNVVQGISINDLRKNLGDLNNTMERETISSAARYGIVLNAALITAIDPPNEVESALAAINTAHNEVSSQISLAQAASDQKIVQSRRAVEIETLRAQAEVQMLKQMADQLTALKKVGKDTLAAYVRNVKLGLYDRVRRIVLEARR